MIIEQASLKNTRIWQSEIGLSAKNLVLDSIHTAQL